MQEAKNDLRSKNQKINLKPFVWYWSWPKDEDKWFYFGRSHLYSLKSLDGSVRFEVYGKRLSFGPVHIAICHDDWTVF